MELREYVQVIRRRWRAVVATLLACLTLAAAYILLVPQTYEARTTLFVSTGAQDPTQLLQGGNFAQQRVKSYVRAITSPTVLGPVIDELGLHLGVDQLQDHITASVPLDTVLIDVAVRDTDAEQAAAVANAVGAQFIATVPGLESTSASPAPVNVTVLQPATAPARPVTPRPARDGLIGLAIGLGLGVVAAFVREAMDTTVRSTRDVRAVTAVPVIAVLPYDPDAQVFPLVPLSDPQSAQAEAFRAFRTNLHLGPPGGESLVLVITSSLPAEGKTRVAANLALTIAATGVPVCLVEGDLRDGSRLAAFLGLPSEVGLTEVLAGDASVDEGAIQRVVDTDLHVLGAGHAPPNPAEIVGSAAMARTIDLLARRFAVVVIDGPPLLSATDAAVMSRLFGRAIVVAGAGMVSRQSLQDALAALARAGADVEGIVLNGVKGGGGLAGQDAPHRRPSPGVRLRRRRR